MSLWWVTLRHPGLPDEGNLHHAQVEADDEAAAIALALERAGGEESDDPDVPGGSGFTEVVGAVEEVEGEHVVLPGGPS